MAMQPSETNFPCTAVQSWTPNAHYISLGCISIKRGDLGKVLSERNNGWIKVWLPRKKIQGSVPTFTVQVHHTRRFGDLRIQHDLPTISSSGIDYSRLEITPNNLVEKTIVAVVTAMKNQQTSLPFMSDGIRNLLNDDTRRQKFLKAFIGRLNGKYVQIVANDTKTIRDFQSALKPVTDAETRTGQYARVTSDFKNDPQRRPEFYTGMTRDSFFNRLHGHRMDANNYTGPSSVNESGREARNMTMYVLCQMVRDDADAHLLAEQTLMLMNGSYVPEMYVAKVERSASSTDPEDNVREAVKSTTRREQANTLVDIAAAVFKELGFVALCQRPNFGVGQGLNYSSPIAEPRGYEKTLWIKVVQSGVKEVYYRSGLAQTYTDSKTFKTSFMNMWRYVGEGSAHPSIMFERNKKHPPQGTILYPIWEIQLDGPHPIPWARLPDLGGPSDWHIANSLALRVEWQDPDGQWWQTFQQADQVTKFEPTTDPGAMVKYNQAMAIIRYLQPRRHFSPKGWNYDCGLARIKELSFNHATQTVKLQELAPPTGMFRKVVLKSTATIVKEMVDVGCLNVGGTWQVRGWRGIPGKYGHSAGGPPSRCDACYIASRYDGDNFRGGSDSGFTCSRRTNEHGQLTDQCEFCYYRGLQCSWTHVPDFTAAMVKALNFKAQTPLKFEKISPRILYLGEEEREADEDDTVAP
ncbi:hypothetical protein OHC33_006130 [Knufia fluminis]|uniref:Uncharacterized protein n=1 Tax=Knufia fluminis TaxID=191047 RepID=A0AAN8EVB3_9EURO|nr:hypothetical protein OHC33_006130 [Knufia fluminis]